MNSKKYQKIYVKINVLRKHSDNTRQFEIDSKQISKQNREINDLYHQIEQLQNTGLLIKFIFFYIFIIRLRNLKFHLLYYYFYLYSFYHVKKRIFKIV